MAVRGIGEVHVVRNRVSVSVSEVWEASDESGESTAGGALRDPTQTDIWGPGNMRPALPTLLGAGEWEAETDEMRSPKYTVCDVWTGRPMRSGRWDIMLSCAYMRGRRVVCRGRSMHTEVL